jgi:hypothetical protein
VLGDAAVGAIEWTSFQPLLCDALGGTILMTAGYGVAATVEG